MTQLGWIGSLIAAHGLALPPELTNIIARKSRDQGPFYFSTADEGAEDTKRMNSLFTRRRVEAFGRRLGRDGVVCLVVADGDYPKRSVLVLHWDGWPGVEVDEDYPSLAAWAKAAANEIAEWNRANPEA